MRAMRWLLPLIAVLACLLAAPRAEALSPPLRAQAEAALACQMEAGFDSAACLREFAASPEFRAALGCLLRGREAGGCLGVDVGLLGGCLAVAGFSLEAAAGCVALRYAAAEAARCVEGGVGAEGGCFPPDHALRRWGRALAETELPDLESVLARWRARAGTLLPAR
jgi:hypothetical protein